MHQQQSIGESSREIEIMAGHQHGELFLPRKFSQQIAQLDLVGRSRNVLGSSSNIAAGSCTRHLPTKIRCRWPPESSSIRRCRRSFRSSSLAISSITCALRGDSMPNPVQYAARPRRSVSRTVCPGSLAGACGRYATRPRQPPPPRRDAPALPRDLAARATWPSNDLMSVVLPTPLGPSTRPLRRSPKLARPLAGRFVRVGEGEVGGLEQCHD